MAQIRPRAGDLRGFENWQGTNKSIVNVKYIFFPLMSEKKNKELNFRGNGGYPDSSRDLSTGRG